MGEAFIMVLEHIFQKIIQAFFAPIKEMFGFFTASPEIIEGFSFIYILYEKMQIIGAALIILIACFQLFKVKFAFLGFECEDPIRILGRVVVFGFLAMYAKDVILLGLDIFDRFVGVLWESYYTTKPSPVQFVSLIMGLFLPSKGIMLFSWSAIIFIYLTFKFIKLAFRFAERLMLTAFLLMISPPAFVAGTSQVTKGFLQGWIKLFVGNLLVQLFQVTIFLAIVFYRATDPEIISLYSFVITVSLIRVLEKLEDIVRDASMNVGIGRDLSSSFQKVQSAVYATTQATQVVNATKMIFGKTA